LLFPYKLWSPDRNPDALRGQISSASLAFFFFFAFWLLPSISCFLDVLGDAVVVIDVLMLMFVIFKKSLCYFFMRSVLGRRGYEGK